MTRVKQFFKAIFAKITEDDRAYIEKYLPKECQTLFYNMAIFDQAHALRVARTTETFNYHGDMDFLRRVALLHDVGRTNINVFHKVFCVLINGLSKVLAIKLSKHFRFLYIYYNHGEIGAELLKDAGFEAEAEIIRLHHAKIENASEELLLLQKADNMN